MSNEPPLCSICGTVLTKKGFHRHLLRPAALSDECEELTVLLLRFRFKSCGHTHVGFPEKGIIPYKHSGEIEVQEAAEALETLEEAPSRTVSEQFKVSEWHKRLGGGIQADSIMDRIIHNSYELPATDNNLRKLYDSKKAQSVTESL